MPASLAPMARKSSTRLLGVRTRLPENPEVEWKPGYSAMEQANAWLRTGKPATPRSSGPLSPTSRPTRMRSTRALSTERSSTTTTADVSTTYSDARGARERQRSFSVSKPRLVRTSPGRSPSTQSRGSPVKPAIAATCSPARCSAAMWSMRSQATSSTRGSPEHGYQLWTAAVGTIIEAQQRGKDEAVLVIHQLRPRDLSRGAFARDPRNWSAALDTHKKSVAAFAADVAAAGGASHKTAFVNPGTKLHLQIVETTFP